MSDAPVPPRRRRREPQGVTTVPPVAPAPAPPPPEPAKTRLPSGFATVRDVLLFVFGCGIIAHEVFVQKTAEAAVIGVGVAMCGLPLVFGADDKRAAK